MALSAEEQERLDKLADEAAKEIPQLTDAHDVAKWLRKWRRATYKRLVDRLCNYYGEA